MSAQAQCSRTKLVVKKHHRQVHCPHEGCSEIGHFFYETIRDCRESKGERERWKCTRHRHPEEVLSLDNLVRETISISENKHTDKGAYIGVYWNGQGFVFGTGYKAYAEDFPVGTKLIVTARIELP